MAKQKPQRQFNSRRYQGKIERELMIGAVLIAMIVGGGLIALMWGRDASLTALGCIALAVGLVVRFTPVEVLEEHIRRLEEEGASARPSET